MALKGLKVFNSRFTHYLTETDQTTSSHATGPIGEAAKVFKNTKHNDIMLRCLT